MLILTTGWIDCDGCLAAEPENKPTYDASRLWINLGGISWHAEKNNERNAFNPGIGLEYKYDEDYAFIAGMYHNSFYARSAYAGLAWTPLFIQQYKLGLIVGAANGYRTISDGNWFPIVLPAATIEGRHYGANLVLIPPFYGKAHGALALQFKFRF